MRDGFVKQPDNFHHATYIGLNRQSVSARRFDFCHDFLGFTGMAGIIDHDRRAAAGKSFRNGAANAA